MAGRRRHDPHRSRFEGTTYNHAAAQVRGRHSEHRRAPSAWARRIDYLEDLGMERIARARARPARATRPGALQSVSGPAHRSAPRARKRRVLSFVLDGIHRTTSARSSISEGDRDSHRSSLRDAGHGALRRAGDGARLARVLQHARRRSTAWLPRSPRRARFSADGPQGPVSRRDHRSQPSAAKLRPPQPGRRISAEGFNPLCGDRARRST